MHTHFSLLFVYFSLAILSALLVATIHFLFVHIPKKIAHKKLRIQLKINLVADLLGNIANESVVLGDVIHLHPGEISKIAEQAESILPEYEAIKNESKRIEKKAEKCQKGKGLSAWILLVLIEIDLRLLKARSDNLYELVEGIQKAIAQRKRIR